MRTAIIAALILGAAFLISIFRGDIHKRLEQQDRLRRREVATQVKPEPATPATSLAAR